MKKNNGKINQKDYKEDESFELTAISGDKFEIVADRWAKIEIMNMGDSVVTVRCSNG